MLKYKNMGAQMENTRNRKHKTKTKSEIQNVSNSNNRNNSSEDEKKPGNNHSDATDTDHHKENTNVSDYYSDCYELKTKNKSVQNDKKRLRISFELDLLSLLLFFLGLATRMYRLHEPRNIVFDELHYGKYVSLYMKNTFFFDSHPPLGKQLIAGAAYLAGYDGSFKFDRIGSPYSETVPLVALRFVPAFFGSLLIPVAYHLLLEMGFCQAVSFLSGLLLLLDNAILTQSRFILMESILLFFSLFGILCILKFRRYMEQPYTLTWWLSLIASLISLTCALSVKYVGFYSFCLGLGIIVKDFWCLLSDPKQSDCSLLTRFLVQFSTVVLVPLAVYISIFYVHLSVLYKAGPHDSIMTSAFQASLEGGLASITKGQPLMVAHGSQITLR